MWDGLTPGQRKKRDRDRADEKHLNAVKVSETLAAQKRLQKKTVTK